MLITKTPNGADYLTFLNQLFVDHLFNLKFAVKEFERNSKKCEKEEKAERAKLKKAIAKGNMEVARIHGENAIRQKNQALNYLKMAARIDAVASRVQTAVTTKKVLLIVTISSKVLFRFIN